MQERIEVLTNEDSTRMNNKLNRTVKMPSIINPIAPSPGFKKKNLSTFKLDIYGLCEFGCTYCSSNSGNYLRINKKLFADFTEVQLGTRIYPDQDPNLTFE